MWFERYTRQRQGRDFPSNGDRLRREYENERSFLNRLETFKQETERNAVPIDGEEPAPERAGIEKGGIDRDI